MISSREESPIGTGSEEPEETRIFPLAFGTTGGLPNNKDGSSITKDTVLIKVE